MRSRCRACGSRRLRVILSLGASPLANSNLSQEQLGEAETFFPLDLKVCEDCFLAQLDEFESPEDIFSDYAYFSSWSTSWLEHAKAYVDAIVPRLGLNADSQVIEIASNDGYLLQYFLEREIPVLGIEPATNVAQAALEKGIPTRVEFWGSDFAQQLSEDGLKADLILGNNVLAHVPNLNDFVAGLRTGLKARGVVTMEFPHVYQLIEQNQFDTIYHEHFSYFSFFVVREVFANHGLELFDVEELPTHGGSLRIYAKHAEDDSKPISDRVAALLEKERQAGATVMDYYLGFAEKVCGIKRDVLDFLIQAKRQGKRLAGYGAAAKGNTLLNYCGIRTDFIDYIVDRSPHKQGLYTPGARIPIRNPEVIAEDRPDYLFILPWNIKSEIIEQMTHIRSWGGQFVVPIPKLEVID